MASISSLTSSSNKNSLKGISGLASGMDTDTLIENMTAGTRAKITKNAKSKQLLQWKTDAFRSISDKMIAFSNNFISLTGKNSLYSENTFARNKISLSGANSSCITASGSSTTADSVSIAAIERLAANAKMNIGKASDGTLKSTGVDFASEVTIDNLSGSSIKVNVNDKAYNVDIKINEADFERLKNDPAALGQMLKTTINDALKGVATDSGVSLDKLVTFDMGADGKASFTSTGMGKATVSGDALAKLGFSGDIDFTSGNTVTGADPAQMTAQKQFPDIIGGKTITFEYNGTKASITLKNSSNMTDLKKDLQEQLDKTFGKDRIQVDSNGNTADGKAKLEFKTMNPNTGAADNTSVLKVVTGDGNTLTALGLNSGESNRVDLTAALSKSGLDSSVITALKDLAGESASYDGAVQSLLEKINAKGDVSIKYSELSDSFSISSAQKGVSGNTSEIQPGRTLEKIQQDLAAAGGDITTDFQKGQDALIWVKYEGNDSPIQISRDSNTFQLEGMSITANKTFGMKEDPASPGNLVVDDTAEAITFKAAVNTEKTTSSVKAMIEAYNELTKLINTEAGSRPDREYTPLTSDEKKEMTDDEIKLWEEKAKQGVLSNDSDLRELASSLRFVFTGGDLSVKELEEMGINISNEYSDNGKISFDEDKFKAALEKDPEKISDFFTEAASTNDKGGVMARLKSVSDKYASSTGGILVEKAGNSSKPTSLLANALKTQMDAIDKDVAILEKSLKKEQDRYQRQFTQLEQLISSMNAQSSQLSSMFSQ